MKNLYFVAFLFCFGSLYGQARFEAEMNPCKLQYIADPMVPDQICHNRLFNRTRKTLNILWEREDLLVPAGWETYVCDNEQCYSSFVTKCPEDNYNKLLVDSNIILDVHIADGGMQGEAHVVLWVFEKEDTTKKLKIDYLFNKTLSTKGVVSNQVIKMYPNPAYNSFTIDFNTGLSRVELYTILGKKVTSYSAQHFKSYDISFLEDGMYMVKLIGSNNQTIKTLRLQKRSLRS
ncbi:MAG: T9SS type A sorting domain-containing protein [Saprospiraceae bacterium]|nr:T9SS type A sorting domain-containing protein [Candidatus Vicinibacter affinis]HQX44958.1 T9SS type A sorting domain-containing protein [Saprospiraceae bacterium]